MLSTMLSTMLSYFGKIIRHVYGEDKLIQKDDEIARLMQLLSQRDAEIEQKNAEMSRYEAEFSRKDTELDQKYDEIARLSQLLSQRDEEFSRKDTELALLVQLLSQRDEEIIEKNDEIVGWMQLLSQRNEEIIEKNLEIDQSEVELSRTKQQIVELQQSIHEHKENPVFNLEQELTYIDPIKYKSYWEKKFGEIWPDKWCHIRYSCIDICSDIFKDIVSCLETLHEKEPIYSLYHQFKSHLDECDSRNFKLFGYMYAITKCHVYRLVYVNPVIKNDEAVLNIPKATNNDFYMGSSVTKPINSIIKAIPIHKFNTHVNLSPIISYCSGSIKGVIGNYNNGNGSRVSSAYMDDLMTSSLDTFTRLYMSL
jgi:hypothetical protein